MESSKETPQTFNFMPNQEIRIVACSDSRLWYNSRIGETFRAVRVEKFLPENKVVFWVRTGGKWNTLNFINFQDVELV